MLVHNGISVLVTGAALALVGFGISVSRIARFARLAGMVALAYGVYLVLAVTKVVT